MPPTLPPGVSELAADESRAVTGGTLPLYKIIITIAGLIFW